MDQDVMNWWLEFEEKKPDENVIDTFESQINLAIWYCIIGIILIIFSSIFIIPAIT